MVIVPCGNPTPKKLPTGGGEWPTFRTARAQRTVRPLDWRILSGDLSLVELSGGSVLPTHPSQFSTHIILCVVAAPTGGD